MNRESCISESRCTRCLDIEESVSSEENETSLSTGRDPLPMSITFEDGMNARVHLPKELSEQDDDPIDDDDLSTHDHDPQMKETHKVLMNLVQDVLQQDRKSDILQIMPRRHKSSRVIMLFDDMKTSLVQDCLSIDSLVRSMLNSSSVKRRHPADASSQCAVCTESLEGSQYIRRLSCNHEFHCTCIRKAFLLGNNAKCPLCRYDFLSDYVQENLSEEYPDPDTFLGKSIIANALLCE